MYAYWHIRVKFLERRVTFLYYWQVLGPLRVRLHTIHSLVVSYTRKGLFVCRNGGTRGLELKRCTLAPTTALPKLHSLNNKTHKFSQLILELNVHN